MSFGELCFRTPQFVNPDKKLFFKPGNSIFFWPAAVSPLNTLPLASPLWGVYATNCKSRKIKKRAEFLIKSKSVFSMNTQSVPWEQKWPWTRFWHVILDRRQTSAVNVYVSILYKVLKQRLFARMLRNAVTLQFCNLITVQHSNKVLFNSRQSNEHKKCDNKIFTPII